MARHTRTVKPLETIWEVDDQLWGLIESILAEMDPPRGIGRPRIDQRAALNGIIFQMRTGCQWNQLPKTFGDDSSVHRTFQRWVNKGVLQRIWAQLVQACEELGGVDWRWQSADGILGKARLGGTTWAPTPRIGRKTAPSAV